jgi:hypothetical protein
MLLGLRGVGKTVLLDRMRSEAESDGAIAVRIEAPENRSLPAILAPELRLALIRLSRGERVRSLAKRAIRALAGFVKALKLKYEDIELGLDLETEEGLADSGDLVHDLQALFNATGEAARAAETVLVIYADELQYVAERELAALITALHRVSQEQLPVLLLAAGLPQLRGRLGSARSYAERMFTFESVGPLSREDAAAAIRLPLDRKGVQIATDALDLLLDVTQRYPYFLQEWGSHSWDVAQQSPISLSDVRVASEAAVAALDASFFRVRLDRLAPAERRYLRAMAELGPGPHRSGAVAAALGKEVTKLGLVRGNLIAKGMVWSPGYGETAFTVPLFDEFLRRQMPGTDWLTP